MIFPDIFESVYAVGAAGLWLHSGAYAENERQRLFLLNKETARLGWGKGDDDLSRLRENLRAMQDVNEGLRFRPRIWKNTSAAVEAVSA